MTAAGCAARCRHARAQRSTFCQWPAVVQGGWFSAAEICAVHRKNRGLIFVCCAGDVPFVGCKFRRSLCVLRLACVWMTCACAWMTCISVCCAWRVRGWYGTEISIVCVARCWPQAIESSWRWLSVVSAHGSSTSFRFWGRCCAQKNSRTAAIHCSAAVST